MLCDFLCHGFHRITSGATPADILVANMAADALAHFLLQAKVGGRPWDESLSTLKSHLLLSAFPYSGAHPFWEIHDPSDDVMSAPVPHIIGCCFLFTSCSNEICRI